MPEQYYEEGFKRQFEAAIPILIIILLIIGVIALNPGLVRNIPILGDLFGKPAIDALLIGEAATEANDWRTYLSGDLALNVFGNPVNIDIYTDAQYNKISSADWIKNRGYDVVIVTATDLTPALQIVLKEWVQAGGKMLVLGIGGVQSNGRWAELSTVLPVNCGASGDCTGIIETVYAPTLYIAEGKFNNGLARNVDTVTPLTDANGSINVANVVEPDHILYIGGFKAANLVRAGQTGDIYPGVSEKSTTGGGRVVYMSFNPTTENISPAVEQSVVINVLAYTVGMKGYQSI